MLTRASLADYLEVDVENLSESRFELLKAEAVALILSVAPKLGEDVESWPLSAQSVGLRVLGRVYRADLAGLTGVTQLSNTNGDYSQSRTFGDGMSGDSLWLSKQDKAILRGFGGTKAYEIDLMPNPDERRGRWVDTWRIVPF